MENRLENTFNGQSNSCFPTNYLPLLEGVRVQRGDTGGWVLTITRQRDSETSRRTPRVESIRSAQATFYFCVPAGDRLS